MSYLYLTIAIVAEIIATITLKATESFTKPGPSALVLVCVAASLYFFSLSLKSLNVAYVYAVWSGIGIAAVCFLGWLFYGQKLDMPALIGISLIVAGIVVLNLFSTSVELPDDAAQTGSASVEANT